MQRIKTQYDLSDFLMKNLTGEHVTTIEKMVLCGVASFTNPDNDWKCWPSLDTLMSLCCCTRPTIVKATKGLKSKGLLTWEKGKTNVSNKYRIDIVSVGNLVGVHACYDKQGGYNGKKIVVDDDDLFDTPF